MYALRNFGQNYQTRISAVICCIATKIKYLQMLLEIQVDYVEGGEFFPCKAGAPSLSERAPPWATLPL
jgi:hypothetical protein